MEPSRGPDIRAFNHHWGLGMETSSGASSSSGMCSLPCTPVEEERPGSSLSTASRSSRIPRLTRSASLRIKSSTVSYSSSVTNNTPETKTTTEGKSNADPRPTSRAEVKGITRSASFVTSRGMYGRASPPSTTHTPTSSHHRHSSSTPRVYGPSLTPETPRRVHHASAYTRRTTSLTERKTHSYAGLGASSWHPSLSSYHHNNHHNQHHNNHHHHHLHNSRRPNSLSISTSTSSAYVSSSVPATPSWQPETPSRSPDQDMDDADSVKSFGSVSSAVSCDAALTQHHYHQQHSSCGGSSSRGSKSLKYVLHCRHNHDIDPDNYLTPTQRAARRIRELKSQLAEARREVHLRDAEISRLTRELVELRLLKARTQQRDDDVKTNVESESKNSINTTAICNGPSQRGETQGRLATEPRATPSTPTPKTSSTPSEGSEPELSRLMDNLTTVTSESGAVRVPVVSPAGGSVAETTADSVELTRSLADSGHYEDLTSPCLSSRDPFEASRGSLRGPRIDEDEDEVDPWTVVEETEARLREEYERREDQLKRNHMDEYHELKEKHNDRVESLLSKLSDANLKYFELRPMYDRSQERVRELERDVTRLKDELSEAELRHQKMYLQMFLKGQQSAKLQADDQDGEDGSQSSLSSVGPMVDLLKQLSRTEDELEKIKGAVPFLPSSLSSPVIRGLTDTSSLGAPNAALLDGKQAISLYFQGRRQALYHREVACRNNNNNGSSITKNGELDPEVTLQFLKSAIYYFLTDKDNSRGHLRAIESILGYTDSERYNIDKVVK
ncbi:protein quick-to-court isoform X2 [Cherax quadricarinatus]|uniref:protein quick-to-court isoform X2 n=1 Tax=Cherax quadricarinatus TaxID=27406 RepID=UPI00387EE82A